MSYAEGVSSQDKGSAYSAALIITSIIFIIVCYRRRIKDGSLIFIGSFLFIILGVSAFNMFSNDPFSVIGAVPGILFAMGSSKIFIKKDKNS